METGLNEFPWMTAVIVLLALIIVCVGGAVVIWGAPGALSFDQYIADIEKFAVAVGLLGVGRGIRTGAKLMSTRR